MHVHVRFGFNGFVYEFRPTRLECTANAFEDRQKIVLEECSGPNDFQMDATPVWANQMPTSEEELNGAGRVQILKSPRVSIHHLVQGYSDPQSKLNLPAAHLESCGPEVPSC